MSKSDQLNMSVHKAIVFLARLIDSEALIAPDAVIEKHLGYTHCTEQKCSCLPLN
jgi:hypothetical protein